ncbi:camphor resistance protein CrcB [Actinocorallia herbida]|uniref:Fluoride-specific ion channel FluC n=1 Tax=Actinocorallia herbida TaxID=58109 RepID=A0A3N1CW67_9ACTN|nr:CrcB family protein [Actinocorallia herbida]ROO85527.1 camphor resistance protein CrcB [Actinocorallia herbida]
MAEAGEHLGRRQRAEASALDRTGSPMVRRLGAPGAALLDVAIGGAIGALARWLITEAMPGAQEGFPWGTLLVNLLGCLFMGVLTSYLLKGSPHAFVRPLLVTGYLGGFTTFSHLIDGIHALDRTTGWELGLGYAAASVLGGWIAIVVGLWAGARVPHRRTGGGGAR